MAEDWLADVQKYAPDADPDVVLGLVRHCGIALQKRDSSLVAFSDPDELGRVCERFLKNKLELTHPDSLLDEAIAAVGVRMKGDRTKNRVTVYYLLADSFDKLHLFLKAPKAEAGKGAGTSDPSSQETATRAGMAVMGSTAAATAVGAGSTNSSSLRASSGANGGGSRRPGIRCRLLAFSMAFAAVITSSPAGARSDDRLLGRAREAARSDRNAEAAALFAQYLRHTDRRDFEVVREYADQLVYSGRVEAALPLFHDVLSRSDLEPEQRRAAQSGLALAFLWSGQYRHAVESYQVLLSRDPADKQALIGRARALAWMGRPDRALFELDAVSGIATAGTDWGELSTDIARNRRPLIQVSTRISKQSDELDIATLRIEQHIYPRAGAANLSAYYERLRYDPGEGRGRAVDIDHPGLAGRLRFSDWGQVSGQVGLELQRIAGRRKRTEPTFDATLTLMPRDDLRFDFTGARRTLDNVLSIERRITAAYASGSVDYWPTPLLRMTVRAEYGDYSDGNRRRWGQVELERRLRRDPNIFIGARATSFGFSKRLENGYFNPDSFRSAELTARVWHRIGKRSWLDVGAALGVENADPGGSQLAYSGRAKLTHGLSDQVEVSLTADAFSSRTRSDSGFSRQTLTAAIGLRW